MTIRTLLIAAMAMAGMLLCPLECVAQEEIVSIDEENFPDGTFRQMLIKNYDLNGSMSLTPDELEKIVSINFGREDVKTLKGVELLPKLKVLVCSGCLALEELDLSECKSLERLDCENSGVRSLKFGDHSKLKYLYCTRCKLTEPLDLSGCKELVNLYCGSCGLSDLSLENNDKIVRVNCSNNSLRTLHLGGKSMMEVLDCEGNDLTILDVSGCLVLETLKCSGNNLARLDVSESVSLKTLECDNNKLAFLNLEGNKELAELSCKDNICDVLAPVLFSGFEVEGLDVTRISNMKNAKVVDGKIVAEGSGQAVVSYDYDTRWVDDQKAKQRFELDLKELACKIDQQNFPDEQFRQYVYNTFDKNKNRELDENELRQADTIKVSGMKLESLTGIENFVFLKYLSCNDNMLRKLDVSSNVELEHLECNENRLVGLDLGDNWKIKEVACEGNRWVLEAREGEGYVLEGVDMARISNVKGATVRDGVLVVDEESNGTVEYDYNLNLAADREKKMTCILDVHENAVAIDSVNFPDRMFREQVGTRYDLDKSGYFCRNEIENVKEIKVTMEELGKYVKDLRGIEHFGELRRLECSQSVQTEELDLSKNTKLTTLVCNWSELGKLNLRNLAGLKYVECRMCGLEELMIEDCVELETLDCSSNKLEELDLRQNKKIRQLKCGGNALTHLELEENGEIEYLACENMERNLGVVDYNGFEVEGLDMSRIVYVEGAKIVDGKFVPESSRTTEIRYLYDTKIVGHVTNLYEFVLKVNNGANPLSVVKGVRAGKIEKRVEYGRIVIVKDGNKYDISGRRVNRNN